MFSAVYCSNFYYAEASTTPFYVYGSYTQTYDVNGIPDAPREEFYSSYDLQQPTYFPDGNLTGFTCLPPASQELFPFQGSQQYGAPAEDFYIDDLSYMNQSQTSSSYTSDDSTSALNISSSTVPYVEENEGFYPGIFAQSRHGKRNPVLLYRIPKTDLCYVYDRLDDSHGEKVKYLCKECRLLNRFVPAEVISLCYFKDDPVLAGHICHPKRFSSELAQRQAVTACNRSMDHNSGLGGMFN